MDEEKREKEEQGEMEHGQHPGVTQSPTKLFFGTISSAIGIFLSAVGLLILFFIPNVGVDAFIPNIFLAIVFGTLGYSLGSRKLGIAAIVIATLAMFYGLYIGEVFSPIQQS